MNLKDLNKTPEEIIALTEKYMIETYKRFDFVCTKAEGMYLYDENDNAYLDFYGGIAVNSTGNRNPKVVQAIKDQVDEVIHTFNYPYTAPQAVLAEKVCTLTGMDKIFFHSTGTEANEAMIKMARKYGVDNYGPNKYHIITAKKSFHGRTYGALSATGQPDNACQVGFKPMLPGFSYATYNDVESFRELVTEDTIAIMLEPVQGEGGIVPATKEFMQGIKALCDEKKLLLLFDEIQTGWCRTGEVMAFMHYGVKPDIVSMAKAIGGGMPISAICASSEVATAFSLGAHGTTYGGNPVCCAAAYAQISEMMDNHLADNAKEMGAYFMKELSALPHIKEVRGLGLMVAVEFEEAIGAQIKQACLERKLMITAIGTNIIRMVPPLIVTKEDCDKAVSIIKESIYSIY